MSASLVGSEMCIRDSCATPPDQALPQGVMGRSTQPITLVSGRFFWGRRTVSYTHLTLPTICSV
eukprot:9299703-Alexandrium_andersonii.AAC.1